MFVEHEHVEPAHDFGVRMRANNLERRPDRFGIVHAHAGYQRIRISGRDHDRAEVIPVEEELKSFAVAESLSLAPLPQIVGITFASRRGGWILDANVGEGNSILSREAMDDVGIPKQDRRCDSLIDYELRRANYLRLLPFGEDHSLRIAHGTIDDPAHDTARSSQSRLELVAVCLKIHEFLRRTAGNGCPGYSRCDPQKNPGVEGEGNQIVRPELHRAQPIES